MVCSQSAGRLALRRRQVAVERDVTRGVPAASPAKKRWNHLHGMGSEWLVSVRRETELPLQSALDLPVRFTACCLKSLIF